MIYYKKCEIQVKVKNMEDVILLIPSYQPEKIFIKFLTDAKIHFKNIVVVNDGSGEKYDYIFNEIFKMNITVINNFVNMGKGRALKHGINYILQNYNKNSIIVTADSDGQHSIKDIKNCVNKCKANRSALVLGTRNFNSKHVPNKSKFGNKLTRLMFKLFVGLNISDTQTGLRAFSYENAIKFLKISGERFEYETNMLIETKKLKIDIHEVEIETIYLDGNKSTHFNPIKDSINIYKLFLKYIFSAISSFFIDILFFTLIYHILFGFINNYAILISTVAARIISSLYNYLVNSKLVFEQKNIKGKQFIKYYTLVVIQMCVSALSVYALNHVININVTFIKVIVDTAIFVINFYVQREWVFKDK